MKVGIYSKLKQVKDVLSVKLQKTANNADALDTVLEAWLKAEEDSVQGPSSSASSHSVKLPPSQSGPYMKQTQRVTQGNTEQKFFLSCTDSIKTLMTLCQGHRKYCTSTLTVKKVT